MKRFVARNLKQRFKLNLRWEDEWAVVDTKTKMTYYYFIETNATNVADYLNDYYSKKELESLH